MALSSRGTYILVLETTLQAIIMKQCDAREPTGERELFSVGFKRRSKEVTL